MKFGLIEQDSASISPWHDIRIETDWVAILRLNISVAILGCHVSAFWDSDPSNYVFIHGISYSPAHSKKRQILFYV